MGQVNAAGITPGTIVDSDIATQAQIDPAKLEAHQVLFVVDWGYDDTDGTIAIEDYTFFVAPGPCTIRYVAAWHVESGTNTDIDYDLHKNGVTALTGDINLLHGTGDNTSVAGTLASASLVAGDYLTAKIETVTQNTGTQGPRMMILMDIDYV